MTSGFIWLSPIHSARLGSLGRVLRGRFAAPQDEAAPNEAVEHALILRSAARAARLEGWRFQVFLRLSGRQMEGSGTVFGRSIVWPNQVFWIFAIVPSASTLRIAALMASISVWSSSRPTQEK
jgi:hypothetical protein